MAANPLGTTVLRLDEEVRDIDDNLIKTKYRDKFNLEHSWASKYSDLSFILQRYKPQIVHFSGHGNENGAILLEDDMGYPVEVAPTDLSDLFRVFASFTKCVVLSACWSQMQVKAISDEIEYVVSMSDKISNKSAIRFSVGFYRALGSGRNVEEAFELGSWEIGVVNQHEKLIPKLTKNRNM